MGDGCSCILPDSSLGHGWRLFLYFTWFQSYAGKSLKLRILYIESRFTNGISLQNWTSKMSFLLRHQQKLRLFWAAKVLPQTSACQGFSSKKRVQTACEFHCLNMFFVVWTLLLNAHRYLCTNISLIKGSVIGYGTVSPASLWIRFRTRRHSRLGYRTVSRASHMGMASVW